MDKIIVIVKYFVLGMVQGISEMLPISSSGHMKIVERVLDIENEGLALEIFFHLASLLSLLVFFAPLLRKLVVNNCLFVFGRKSEYRDDFSYFIKLVIASVPAAFVGVFLKDKIESVFSDLKFLYDFRLEQIISSTLILPSVIVPVLSVNRIFMLPAASIPTGLRTSTLSFIILFILEDRITAIIIGSPSGTAITITVRPNIRA